jgi:tetratricopeptide (TPR) repeat protein
VLTLVLAVGGFASAQTTTSGRAQEPPHRKASDAKGSAPGEGATQPGAMDSRSVASELFLQPGDDVLRPFVPLRPATVEDRRRIEALRLYSAARALEARRAWADAVALLQEALKLDPESVAITRRLCRIYVGALGRAELAVQYGKRVLAEEPGDSETLLLLVDHFNRRANDPAASESLLNDVLANPRLDGRAPARLLAEYELGRLYSGRLHRIDKAADAFGKVVEALDDRSANRLSGSDQLRVLGNDPAMAYLNFGLIFLAAKRHALAIKAFERGLAYDEDNPQISVLLADTLLKLKKGEQALALVERTIRRQPQGVEAYDLLAKVLTALNRQREITPRLEEAARRDSKNVPLQYLLADRYRETGQVEKAEALYKELLRSQPTPQTYRALAVSLLRRKKTRELLRLLAEAWQRPGSPEAEATAAQLQGAAADDTMADGMLDVGLEQLTTNPPVLPTKSAFAVLSFIANAGRGHSERTHRLEKLLKLQRLLLEQDASPMLYYEIVDNLRRLGRYAEAATMLEEALAKYPKERSVRTLVFLADYHRRAGHNEALRKTLDEAMKGDPGTEEEPQVRLARLLSDCGRLDDAVKVLRTASRKEPQNAAYEFNLSDILTRFGRDEEAIKLLQSLLKRHAGNEKLVNLAHQQLSIIYVNRGDYGKGEAELELLLERNPEDAGPNNDLGYLYAEQGKNLEKAEIMIRKALQEDPDNKAYLDSLGWVLFKRGKAKEALVAMQKAADRMKTEIEQEGASADATIFEHLGDVYFQLQELEKAAESWRDAMKAAAEARPPDKRLPEIRKKLESLQKLGPIPKRSSSGTP